MNENDRTRLAHSARIHYSSCPFWITAFAETSGFWILLLKCPEWETILRCTAKLTSKLSGGRLNISGGRYPRTRRRWRIGNPDLSHKSILPNSWIAKWLSKKGDEPDSKMFEQQNLKQCNTTTACMYNTPTVLREFKWVMKSLKPERRELKWSEKRWSEVKWKILWSEK